MKPLDLVNLTPLMERTSGRPEVVVALIDGPVRMENSNVWSRAVRYVNGKVPVTCARTGSAACVHGTLVAGILSSTRGSPAPAICPGCTLLVRPVFAEVGKDGGQTPNASPQELAAAIIEAVKAGARVVNLSVSLLEHSSKAEGQLQEALNYAARSGVITVVAAGNQGIVGSSALTRHPWVIPVIACDDSGRPLALSNLGASAGARGLRAPGENITSISVDGAASAISGTSAAAPFVTGTAALLWSQFPHAGASAIKLALAQSPTRRQATLVPPLLNAWAAHRSLASTTSA